MAALFADNFLAMGGLFFKTVVATERIAHRQFTEQRQWRMQMDSIVKTKSGEVWICAESGKVVLNPDHHDREGVALVLDPNSARDMAIRLFEQSLSKDEAAKISRELLIWSNIAKERASKDGYEWWKDKQLMGDNVWRDK